jgi:2-polyprenyl-3-methyl-5-hydroxy-6-metoxy-1,4-benzoquinol methylase
MYNRIEVSCPICDSRSYTIKWKPRVRVDEPEKLYGAASGIPGTQCLVKCNECGMIYENPRFPDELILKGYMASDETSHDSQYTMRVESFYRCLNSLKKFLPGPNAEVLDVGTAGGAFLDAANRFGYRATGLEPSEYLVAQGIKRGLKIIQGTIDNHSFNEQSFDLICFWDVIEHLTNPKDALIKVRSLLKPNGILLINYPDIGTWPAKLAGQRYWWILSVHLHHFNRTTLTEICRRSGYKTILYKSYWQTLQFGYLLKMAMHYKIPLSKFIEKVTPKMVKRIPIPYYASQTTALMKVIK